MTTTFKVVSVLIFCVMFLGFGIVSFYVGYLVGIEAAKDEFCRQLGFMAGPGCYE